MYCYIKENKFPQENTFELAQKGLERLDYNLK